MGRIQNVDDFNRIVLAYRATARSITFGDVGRVAGHACRKSAARRGSTAIAGDRRSRSASSRAPTRSRSSIACWRGSQQIQATLPPDLTISIGSDQSRFIRRSFEDIQLHLLLGGLLASLVVFLFIRNLRVTFIAALAIPTSIIGTFTVMKAFGFTLNNMTMLALSLATGIVIDDAIVVLENIFRYVEEKGVTPKEAAAEATREIGLAVMATTLSLVVIFVPVAFMTGQIGRYFYSFGITSAAAILISMFVSFTLTPALCALVAEAGGRRSRITRRRSPRGFYARIDAVYGAMLDWSLHHRAGDDRHRRRRRRCRPSFLYPYVGKELVPDDDQGEFSVNVRLPRGTSYPAHRRVRQADREGDPRAAGPASRAATNVNPGSASFNVTMMPLEERKISQQELMMRARGDAAQVPGRAHQRVGRHRHLRRLVERPAAARRWRRRRRRRTA